MSGSNPVLGEIANEAAIERSSFLVDAARQLDGFLKANAGRIAEVGGLVLIDDDPDYLSVAPDGSFRSRTRYQDEETGEWVSETEVIESAAELVELYNAAEIYAAFADAAREAAGLPAEPTGTDELMEAAGIAGQLGDLIIVDDDDERLTFRDNGHFHAEVLPEEDPDNWRQLDDPEELVQFYDPTDVFGDLAESIAEAFPGVAPELDQDGDSPA